MHRAPNHLMYTPYPYSFNARKIHISREARVCRGLRIWRSGNFLTVVSACKISVCRACVRAVVIMHIQQKCNDIDDVNVEENHHHHEVRARTHAALLQRDALTGQRPRWRWWWWCCWWWCGVILLNIVLGFHHFGRQHFLLVGLKYTI